ncbi:MAG: hypothetical protein IPJ40_20610 [Saprospirales bacterium]|nr:hypothetical protein [Saprospirales bacterium]
MEWIHPGNAGMTAPYSISRPGLTSFSPYAVASSAALPVTWLTFRATLNAENNVDLTWSTASESNNEGFDIQRSANGRDWETIDFVAGAGTTSEVQTYSYTDNSPCPLPTADCTLYYRLMQKDFDGTTDYSPVRVIELTGPQGGIRVYPNPTNEEVTISFAEPTEAGGPCNFFNQNSRLVGDMPLPQVPSIIRCAWRSWLVGRIC